MGMVLVLMSAVQLLAVFVGMIAAVLLLVLIFKSEVKTMPPYPALSIVSGWVVAIAVMGTVCYDALSTNLERTAHSGVAPIGYMTFFMYGMAVPAIAFMVATVYASIVEKK